MRNHRKTRHRPFFSSRQQLLPSRRRIFRLARRRFLARTAGATIVLGASSLLAGCGSDEADHGFGDGSPPASGARTLFFDLSHEDVASTSYSLMAAGRKYRLVPVDEEPGVLRQARQVNAFLRAVPDAHITHHVRDVRLPTDSVTLSYVMSSQDPAAGTWAMSSMVQLIPPGGAARAFAVRQADATGGSSPRTGSPAPLPLSAKRALHGVPAAATEQDLRDELDLLDTTDHASTLIALHPDMFSVEPGSAMTVHANHVSISAQTVFLAAVIRQKGPALPQKAPDTPNGTGWATLVPLIDTNGQPIRNRTGANRGFIQYFPDWDAQVDERAGSAMMGIRPGVRNDDSLGADLTGMDPEAPHPEFAGRLWGRYDGLPAVVLAAPGAPADSVSWSVKNVHHDAGCVVAAHISSGSGGAVQVTLKYTNWLLCFLAPWLQFLDANGNLLELQSLSGYPDSILPGHGTALDTTNSMSLGFVGQVFTLLAVPVDPGVSSTTFNVPKEAHSVRFLATGSGRNGADEDYNPDAGVLGSILTIFVSLGLTVLFAAAGAGQKLSAFQKLVIVPIAIFLVKDLLAVLGAILKQPGALESPAGWIKLGIATLTNLVQTALLPSIVRMLTLLYALIEQAQLEDAIPVVGQVMRAVSAAVGAASVIETVTEVSLLPRVLEKDLVINHDLTVILRPDRNNNQFPQVPPGYALYYRLTCMFDNGSPHVLDAVDVPDPTVPQIVVTLPGIPRGGQVNLSVGFYARSSAAASGPNDWCAAKGTTGLVDNTVDEAPDIVIDQIKVPILPSTRYLHTRKIQLDAQGRHVWSSTAPAPVYVPPPGGQLPGDLGAFRSITVRQGTATQAGYVGYAWQAFSRKLLDCSANATGQLDQAANLNTDAGNGGANAQNGYAFIPCGLQGGATNGVRVGYSLLSNDSANFYLDTSSLLLRQVRLDPPQFVSRGAGQVFGQLNLDSTALLLHPSGHVVSINNVNHMMETLRLPAAPLSDSQAALRARATLRCGQGSRPGLMNEPVAAAISADGVILVLEAGNNRIQAFDLGGSPVPWFKQQAQPYFLLLPATEGANYLDMAIEFSGYLYVLSQDSSSLAIRLDIYHPQQAGAQPICTTPNVNGARLTVDFWRSVYTLNYEVLQLPGGAIPDITEPSVSLWEPTPPPG